MHPNQLNHMLILKWNRAQCKSTRSKVDQRLRIWTQLRESKNCCDYLQTIILASKVLTASSLAQTLSFGSHTLKSWISILLSANSRFVFLLQLALVLSDRGEMQYDCISIRRFELGVIITRIRMMAAIANRSARNIKYPWDIFICIPSQKTPGTRKVEWLCKELMNNFTSLKFWKEQ